MFSMKSVNVRGRLPDGNLSYRLCPSTEFSKGSWQMAIGSISCHSVVDQKVLCSVSSNVSVDQKYSKEGEIETYEQPLVTFYLSVRPNEKISTRFYPMWFNINRQSDTLFLKFFDASTDEKLKSNCTIITTLLLRKVA